MARNLAVTQETQREGWRGVADALAARVARTRLRDLAWLLALLIVFFGVMGALFLDGSVWVERGWRGAVRIGDWRIHGFNLDGEWNLPTAYSALLLLGASAAGFLVAATGSRVGIRARHVVPVASVLGFMALDEVWQLHERIEAATGVDWQTLYAPVFALAAVATLWLLPDLRRSQHALPLFAIGAGCWAVAQVIEQLQWDPDNRMAAAWTIVPEECLEMAGSLLFLLAFLAVVRAIARAAPRPQTSVT